MKKFLALYMAPTAGLDAMKNATPEEMKEWGDSWTGWMKAHEQSFADQGAPVGANKRVNGSGVEDVRNEATGYSVVEAESHEAAADMFKDNPMLSMPGSYIEVLEIMPMSM